ncbi:hypothetical protein MMC16_002929 [Acarospora aff. strigata]|nr:hypothetical protein [Acarospora aff. strigata]
MKLHLLSLIMTLGSFAAALPASEVSFSLKVQDDPPVHGPCLRACFRDQPGPDDCGEGKIPVELGDGVSIAGGCWTCCLKKEPTLAAALPASEISISLKVQDDPPSHGISLRVCWPDKPTCGSEDWIPVHLDNECWSCCLKKPDALVRSAPALWE